MSPVNENFSFSRREKRGLIILGAIIILIIISNVITYYFATGVKYDFSEYESEINSFLLSINATEQADSIELFYFDPNMVSEKDLIKLGVPQKVAENIIHYREKGGQFRKPSDFAKIYGLNNQLFEKLEPYMVFTETTSENKKTEKTPSYFTFDPNTASEQDLISLGIKKYVASNMVKFREKGGQFRKNEDLLNIYGFDTATYKKLEAWIKIDPFPVKTNLEKPVSIDINSATVNDLDQLKGIGISYANRIISYRVKLGGYSSIDQLKEVYGMTEELFVSIAPSLTADITKINCIQLNTCDFKQLISHPYLEKPEVQAILNYRSMVIKIKSVDELLKQKVISAETYSKMKPYFCTD